jgi:hypothetical protein
MSILGGIILFLGIIWGIQGNDFFMYKMFAPKYEQVRYDTWKQSQSYNQGMAQEIQNMQLQYNQADEQHKEGLRSIILHRVADYDISKLPPDTQQFINNLKKGN